MAQLLKLKKIKFDTFYEKTLSLFPCNFLYSLRQ